MTDEDGTRTVSEYGMKVPGGRKPETEGSWSGADAAGGSASEAAADRPVLQVEHLVKRYPQTDRAVLDDVSFMVPAGKVFVVLGPSGSGKSTLLRTIAGLEPIQGGRILLDGQVIEEGSPQAARRVRSPGLAGPPGRSRDMRTRVGMVFQSYDLFPNRTVLGNITMAPVLVQKRESREVRQEALDLLDRVGLGDHADDWPDRLSGGQRQRVAICRALILHPEIMLFDEVTAALDPEMVREVLQVMLELADQGLTMMIVTHEMTFARAIADHIVLLDEGGLVEESDDPKAFFDHPRTERAQRFLSSFTYERRRREGAGED
ncbi:amino acid ABC transporter ATP-binding protein [Bifidobacterium favimelis]|uniref:Amino acid ABC transporter ATP-binding protein n=1 Tax=Bifidobacterium favimelis TaxID=3122979 RepID=A0ABU8ZLG5_9BIFI